jgi:hypothetical protein
MICNEKCAFVLLAYYKNMSWLAFHQCKGVCISEQSGVTLVPYLKIIQFESGLQLQTIQTFFGIILTILLQLIRDPMS